MRILRPLPQIVRDRKASSERLRDLLVKAYEGQATRDEVLEIGDLDAQDTAFNRMCRRSGPLSAIELGFEWGDELTHAGSDTVVIVRESALVEIDGERMTLMEATTRIARQGVRASLGGWTGSAGRVGLLARLEPIPTPDEDEQPLHPAMQAAAEKPAKVIPKVKPGTNYDLFS